MDIKKRTRYICYSKKDLLALLRILEKRGVKWKSGDRPTESVPRFSGFIGINLHKDNTIDYGTHYFEGNYAYPLVEFYDKEITIEKLLMERSENSS